MRGMHVNVIGLGHRLRHDDALGLFLLERLHKRGVPEGVRLIKAGGDQSVLTGLLDNTSQGELLLIVDAICLGAVPGTIHYLPNMSASGAFSDDRLGLFDMRPFYFQTSEANQDRLVIIGLEPADLSRGVGLTPIVRKRLPALEVAVRSCIVQFGRVGLLSQPYENAEAPSPSALTRLLN